MAPGDGHLLALACPFHDQIHLALDRVAVDPDLVVTRQRPGVEPKHLSLRRLDRPVHHLHDHRVVEPSERVHLILTDPVQLAALLADLFDEGMDVPDLVPLEEDRVPGLLCSGRWTREEQQPRAEDDTSRDWFARRSMEHSMAPSRSVVWVQGEERTPRRGCPDKDTTHYARKTESPQVQPVDHRSFDSRRKLAAP